MLPITSFRNVNTQTPNALTRRAAFLCEPTERVPFIPEKVSPASPSSLVFEKVEILPQEPKVSALTELVSFTRRTGYVTYLK